MFRRSAVININAGLILSTPISNRAFPLGFPIDTLVIIWKIRRLSRYPVLR